MFSGTLLYQYFENRFEPVKAASKSYTDLIKEADALYDQQKFEELYNVLVAEKVSHYLCVVGILDLNSMFYNVHICLNCSNSYSYGRKRFKCLNEQIEPKCHPKIVTF